ncbi:hypothetical protein SAMN02787118_1401 [Streptomyces mirabilis]|jgi:hypothetical protein|uniref:Uncharacterized protein n=1 Tax=Streptomyces mirabilis TaxID=68239 RepID=A0A1I2WVH9_9ACTN|nr:hypothetical protein SAMN02787118_1401 [Streptomyces mirabilis]
MSRREFLILSFVAAVLMYPVYGGAAALAFFFGIIGDHYVK